MSKLAKKQATKTVAAQAVTPQLSLPPVKGTSTKIRKEDGEQLSKQARFLAGVVQKKLRLKLNSKKIDGNRIYRIVSASGPRSSSRRASRHPA